MLEVELRRKMSESLSYCSNISLQVPGWTETCQLRKEIWKGNFGSTLQPCHGVGLCYHIFAPVTLCASRLPLPPTSFESPLDLDGRQSVSYISSPLIKGGPVNVFQDSCKNLIKETE